MATVFTSLTPWIAPLAPVVATTRCVTVLSHFFEKGEKREKIKMDCVLGFNVVL